MDQYSEVTQRASFENVISYLCDTFELDPVTCEGPWEPEYTESCDESSTTAAPPQRQNRVNKGEKPRSLVSNKQVRSKGKEEEDQASKPDNDVDDPMIYGPGKSYAEILAR